MANKVIGFVTEEEKTEIEKIFERKNGLSELILSYTENVIMSEELKNSIYERLVSDMAITQNAYNNWWMKVQKKYNWIYQEDSNYHINFLTNEISLVKNCH